jgi:hypothetical protein
VDLSGQDCPTQSVNQGMGNLSLIEALTGPPKNRY